MTWLVLLLISICVFFYSKSKITNDWNRVCSVVYGGTAIRVIYVVVMIGSLICIIVFGLVSHNHIINYLNNVMK